MNKITSRLRHNASGWRFVFGIFVFLCIFSFFMPLDRIISSINAIGGNTEIINLYAKNFTVENAQNDYSSGWWNTEKLQGSADLAPDAGLLDFSDENSAFFAGGNDSLKAGGFVLFDGELGVIKKEEASGQGILPQTEENIEAAPIIMDLDIEPDQDVEDYAEEAILIDEAEFPIPVSLDAEIEKIEDYAAEPGLIAPIVIADEPDDFDKQEEDANDIILNSDEKNEADALIGTVEISGEATQENEAVVEIIDNGNSVEAEVEIVPAAVGENMEVSFFGRLKNYFGVIAAQAQEIIKKNILQLDDLGEFKKAKLKFSFAMGTAGLKTNPAPDGSADNESTAEDAAGQIITLWYANASSSASEDSDGLLWHKIDTLSAEQMSNALNGGYFSYDAPFLESWDDIKDMQVKFEGQENGQKIFTAYLDSVWVEAEYEPSEKVIREKKRQRWQDALEVLSGQIDFKVNEAGELKFRFNKNKTGFLDILGEMLGFSSFWKDINLRIELYDNFGKKIDLPLDMIFEEDGEFTIKLPEYNNDLRPGKYALKFIIADDSGSTPEIFEITQNFNWGVLAINTDKSVYTTSDESAFMQIAVLDDNGHTICDAELSMAIESPNGIISEMSTADGQIVANELCSGDTVISLPDYYTHYMLYSAGEYKINLNATTTNGFYSISDKFEVRESVPFDIGRTGPTRIYPKAEYGMGISVVANEDFSGALVETVPEGFAITNYELRITNSLAEDLEIRNYNLEIEGTEKSRKFVFKDIEMNQGDILNLNYTFDAPNESPEFYLLGPAEMEGYGTSTSFAELRAWQIASDAPAVATSTNGTNVNWTSPASAWDNGINTYASRLIPKKTGGGEPANYIQSTVNSAINLGGVINTVEIGIEGYVANTIVTGYLVPYFNGSTAGTEYSIAGATIGTSDNDITKYVAITSDVAGPGAGNWTWNDIMNLDIRIYGGNNSNSVDYTFYIDQIRINVDYTANTPPNAAFLSASQRMNASGAADISIQVSDANSDLSRARLDYAAGTACIFSPPLDPTLDNAEANATSSILDVDIDNNSAYQIGTTTDLIRTTSANDVHFDWLSLADLNNQEGVYCLKITANDFDDDDPTPATTTLMIDNKAPTAPGAFVSASTTKDSAMLFFGATSTDANFSEYRIYYATSSAISESSYLFASTSDAHLLSSTFAGYATTTIGGLSEGMTYYFSLYAYDEYGHVSSSTPVSFTTNKAPLGVFYLASPAEQRNDASGIIDIAIEADDLNNDLSKAKIEFATGSDCVFSPAGDPSLDEAQGNISATFGLPKIENDNDYQIGLMDYWIQTPATNTLAFNWFGKNDLPQADGTYCLRLTVNDGKDDQNIPATTTLTLDNVKPTAPGSLSEYDVSTSTITLSFGATTTETNFAYYKIYYKAGTSGVTEAHTPHNDADLNDKYYGDTATTTIEGLDSNTDYVINIWAYDAYGNKASSTEITVKTNATIYNNSLLFINPVSSNIAVAGEADIWTFRASVTEENGYANIDSVVFRLADETDDTPLFSDLEFTWDQSSNTFSETGADALSAVSVSDTSSSDCAGMVCELDFDLVFSHNFSASSTDYAAELYSTNDSALYDSSFYSDFYQVKIVKVKQIHYRWRNDDGGE